VHAKEVYEVLVALGFSSFLAVVGVGVYLYFEADERHLLDWLKPSSRPPAENLVPPVRAAPPEPKEKPAPRVEPERTAAPAPPEAPAAEHKATTKPPSRPPVFAFPVSEEQMRRGAREAVAGSPERLRHLEALIAERDAIIRSGGTPPPCTAQDLLRNL
jgi:hypothetical protein